MSRIGKKIIEILPNTEVKIEKDKIFVKGPKGELSLKIHPAIIINKENFSLKLDIRNRENKKEKSLWGTFQRLISNMIFGVNQGYEKKLELIGVGYRASIEKNRLVLNLGFSHPVNFMLPVGIEAKIEKNIITITGVDKQQIGEIAAQIRRIKKPEPYKGTGIRYFGEVVRKKAGKKAVAGAG